MDPQIRSTLRSLIVSILFLILFLVVLPPLLRVLDQPVGKIIYGAFLVIAIGLALRLRGLAKRL